MTSSQTSTDTSDPIEGVEQVLDVQAPETSGATVAPAVGEETDHRTTPRSEAFRRFIADGWGPRPAQDLTLAEVAPFAARRREALSALFPGEVLVVPAGTLVRRSNDTDYRFRPHSAFAHLTGLGTDREADAVLVLHPRHDGHEAVLYVRPQAGRDTEEFFADARYGELWVGPRESLAALAAQTGLACHDIGALAEEVGASRAEAKGLRLVPDADPGVTTLVTPLRGEVPDKTDDEFVTALSELRLVKDAWEVGQLREAIAASARGFEQVVRALPRAVGHPRGERVVEATFDGNARVEGNAVGYETISAAGDHACTLHWIRNDGAVSPGQLLLLDAGVEVDSLYTADVTRTLPVDGTFTEPQRRVYQAVLDAAEAAFAVAKPGVRFREVHEAAMTVVAERLSAWGMLPVDAKTSLEQDGQFHRRWMPHGTSHHLGLDVHDCAQARKEMYLDAELREGMVFTIEPGIYIKTEDELAPVELRGIGVRIEDDVLVTADGVENLSAALPRTPEAVEAWMASLR
ncbi:aminopeptidase P family protein [Kineococcus rhizosphaerae]|uniref:Xaa-Pro aminopeptidase n=1 Tax=Kineococcus rhizosphaerae TaxID=559628 RepID=A0A2T0R451_9ACTN|nr:aminopeptidase P family protein [Kineococcus rhizosphaerae]PRY15141.1 Xaa-Pro aminopeptidase [Kineococcus rhizosphaerae]